MILLNKYNKYFLFNWFFRYVFENPNKKQKIWGNRRLVFEEKFRLDLNKLIFKNQLNINFADIWQKIVNKKPKLKFLIIC